MNTTTLLDENYTSTLNTTLSNNLTFKDIISSPLFYGSEIIIFIILLLCVITFIFILNLKRNGYFLSRLFVCVIDFRWLS